MLQPAPRRLVLASIDPWRGDDHFRPFDYGVRRIAAAVRGSTRTADLWQVDILSRRDADVDALVEAIVALSPDVVGFSTYVWSIEPFLEAARRLKALPNPPVILLGGPSARPVSFVREPLRSMGKHVDAMVLGDGEEIIVDVLSLDKLDKASLAAIEGVAVASPFGMRGTKRSTRTELDASPSPYQLGLVPRELTAHLEIFRGCPLKCAFCQWGSYDGERIASADHLVRELGAIAALEPRGILLVDAGLNLNARAFRALSFAEKEVGLLKKTTFSCSFYPTYVRPEHLELLSKTRAHVGIGIQSIDPEVLHGLDRSAADIDKIAGVVKQVAGIADVLLEIIVGLPGDSPEGFWRTFEWARAIGSSVNVYHCLVLPDAILDRAAFDDAYDYDPRSFLLRKAPGWTPEALERTQTRLDDEARLAGDTSMSNIWHFPGKGRGMRGQNRSETRGRMAT